MNENEFMINIQPECVCIDLFDIFNDDIDLEKVFPKEEYWQ